MNTFKQNFIIFILFLLFGCTVSLIIGPEKFPFDTLSYHLYNAHAFIHNKVGIDVCPAGIYSYLNPIIELPFYFAVKYLNEYPKLAAFIAGSPFGVYLFTLYKLFDLIFLNKNRKLKISFLLISLICAAAGTIAVANIGTTYNDMICVNLIFIAIFIIFRSVNINRYKNLLLFLCGMCLGLGCGIKLQYSVNTVAALLTIILCKNIFKISWKNIFAIIAGSVFSFCLYNLYWYCKIFSLWGNPIFPYANNIFKSPYSVPEFLDKEPFQYPDGILQTIFFPFYLLKYQMDGQRDTRIPILLISLCSYLTCVIPFKKQFETKIKLLNKYTDVNCLKFLIIFTAISYLLWLFINPYSRYILPLESLCMIFVIPAVFLVLAKMKKIRYITVCLFIALAFITLTSKNCIQLGYRTAYDNKIMYYQDMGIEDNSTVILDFFEWTPSGVVAFQNPGAIYITYPFLNPGNDKNNYKQNIPAFKPILQKHIEEAKNKNIYIISGRNNLQNDFNIFLQNHIAEYENKPIETNMPIKLNLYKFKPSGEQN